MRQELKNIEYIEQYLEGTLNYEDSNIFEQHLKEDDVFRHDVELQNQLVGQLKEEAFLQDINEYHHQFINPKKTSNINKFWFWGIPLLTALLLLWGWNMLDYSPEQKVAAVQVKETNETSRPSVAVPVPNSDIEQSSAFAKLQRPFNKVRLRGAVSIRLKGTASVLNIPKNALIDEQGKIVRGSYELQYRQLNDAPSLAFSPMPMQFEDSEGLHNFSEAAVFEIKAFKNGKALQLAPGKVMTLDYEAKSRNKALQLYHFDKDAGKWKSTDQTIRFHKRGAYEEVLDSVEFKKATADFEAKQAAKNRGPERAGNNINLGSTALMPEGIEKLPEPVAPLPNQYLVKHFYNPKIIKELQLRSFGAYNLSEVYKVDNQVAIEAEYRDEDGNKIEDAYLLTVIDLHYDAAYSFKTDEFICNSTANNIFILWTRTGGIYTFVKRATVQLKTGKYAFNMENLSSKINSIKDLKRYLKFVKKATQHNVTK